METLITGASGFVGTNLQNYLQKDYHIRPLSTRYNPNQTFNLVGYAVIHLAGKAHDLKKVTKPKDYYEANYELTKQLFDAFLMSNAKVFIFMSTVKAVADEVEGVLTEEAVSNPKTHYGIAKRQAEEYILSKAVADDKRVYILRPCMIHGPSNKGNLNLLYQLVSKGLPWPLGSFTNKRSFLSIENLCFVIRELLKNEGVPSGVYNISDDESLSTNELIQLLATSIGKSGKIWKINTFFIKGCAKFGDYFNLPLNSERLKKLTDNYEVSNNKITNIIGKSLPINSKEGLLRTFHSFNKDK